MHLYLTLNYPSTMMFDAYLVDLLAQKDVLTDRQTDRQTDGWTFAFLELLSQLKKSCVRI